MSSKPLVTAPLHTLGGQLVAMTAFRDTPNTLATLESQWHVVETICSQQEITVQSLGQHPVSDDEVYTFKQKFIDAVRPRFDNALFAIANRPATSILHWQSLNPEKLSTYAHKDIISAEAASKVRDAFNQYTKEILNAKERVALCDRLKILNEYLGRSFPPTEELNNKMKDVLKAYGLSKGILTIPSIISPDKFMEFRMALLDMVQPKIENEIMGLVLQLPSSQTLGDIGISEQMLIDAVDIGVITERTFGKIISVLPRITALADAAAEFAEKEAVLTDQLAVCDATLRLSTRAALGAATINFVGAGFVVLAGEWVYSIPLLASSVILSLVALITSGKWKPKKIWFTSKKKSKSQLIVTTKKHTADSWKEAPTVFDDPNSPD